MKKIYKFWASWCQPCKALEPRMANIEYTAIDVEDPANKELVNKFGIRSVPTIAIVEDTSVLTYTGRQITDSVLDTLRLSK